MNYTPEKLLELLKLIAFLKAQAIGSDADRLDAISEIIKDYAERQNPQPLTLEQLREMNGMPVWLTDKSDYPFTQCVLVARIDGDWYEFVDAAGHRTRRQIKKMHTHYDVYAHQPKGEKEE